MLRSLAAMKDQGTRDIRHRALVKTILWRQQNGEPVHRWPVIETNETQDWRYSYQTVGQFMSTDLFTVQPDDLIDLAANMMDWRHIRHVPVENEEGKLVGLLSHRALLRRLAQGKGGEHAEPIAVRSIMKPNPVTATPQTPTLEAIALMRRHRVGCLPVIEGGNLVGIVTAQDFLEISAQLFEQHLEPQGKQPAVALAAISDSTGD
jgi:CBS domain-containing protein